MSQINNEDHEIWYVESIYGANTKKPLVKIAIHQKESPHAPFLTMMSPDRARAMALTLLEVAEAAESDACVVRWLQSKIHQSDETAARILLDLRKFREATK